MPQVKVKTLLLIFGLMLSTSFVFCQTGKQQVIVKGKYSTPPAPPPPDTNAPAGTITQQEDVIVAPASTDSNQIYTYAEVMPSFKGDMNSYLVHHIVYPKMERESGIYGRVWIQFVVERDGTITHIVLMKGVVNGPGLAKEAMRVISTMPNWSPGMMYGKPVRTSTVIPVSFSLD